MTSTIYIYDNSLLGENGDQFSDASCIDAITMDTDEECLAEAEADYDSDYYSYSFVKHEPSV